MWVGVFATKASYCEGVAQTSLRLAEITLAWQPNSGNMDRLLRSNSQKYQPCVTSGER
jgi:hypothetical protein